MSLRVVGGSALMMPNKQQEKSGKNNAINITSHFHYIRKSISFNFYSKLLLQTLKKTNLKRSLLKTPKEKNL